MTVPPFKYVGKIDQSKVIEEGGIPTVNLDVIKGLSSELRGIIGSIEEKVALRGGKEKYIVSGKFKLQTDTKESPIYLFEFDEKNLVCQTIKLSKEGCFTFNIML